jgi:general secretion pathway protein F
MANELPAKSFSFTALTASRQTLAGARLAADEDDLAAMLRAEGLVPLRIARSGGKSGWRGVMMTDLSFGPAVNAKDMAGIIFELGSLLSAGITLDESLSVIAEGRTKPRQSSFIRSVHEAIKSGASLHMALSQHPKEVADYVIGIIKAGEASGSLGPTLVRLATDLQEQQSSIAEFRKALVYPIILAVTALIVIFVLFVVVVPQLEGLFSEQARHALPLVAQAVLSISAFIRDTWLILLALFVLGTAGLIGASRSKMARGPLDRMWLRLPLLGPVLRSTLFARACLPVARRRSGGARLGAFGTDTAQSGDAHAVAGHAPQSRRRPVALRCRRSDRAVWRRNPVHVPGRGTEWTIAADGGARRNPHRRSRQETA